MMAGVPWEKEKFVKIRFFVVILRLDRQREYDSSENHVSRYASLACVVGLSGAKKYENFKRNAKQKSNVNDMAWNVNQNEAKLN